jgi:hypothetical protein
LLKDDLQKFNTIIRFTQGDARNGFSLTAQGYDADWNSTDQVPVRANRHRATSPGNAVCRGRLTFPEHSVSRSERQGEDTSPSIAVARSKCARAADAFDGVNHA